MKFIFVLFLLSAGCDNSPERLKAVDGYNTECKKKCQDINRNGSWGPWTGCQCEEKVGN